MKRFIVLLVAASLALGVGVTGAGAAAPQNLLIATATMGGTYYPVGVAIGTLISIKLGSKNNITATAINSAGSGENIQMMKNNECQLSILQGLFGAMAYYGKGQYEGQAFKDFRSISMLWENVEHFALLKKYAKTGNINDLKGLNEKFSIGKRGSGTEGSGLVILGGLGIEIEKDYKPEYLAYDPSASAMMDNRIVGANLPAGPPVSSVTMLYAQLGEKKVAVLDFSDADIAAVRKAFPVWTRYVVKKGTYPGQMKDINTIAQPNFLACRPDLPEETVYLITKTIFENLPFLHNIHSATKAMSLDRAVGGLPAPLHPGALKYYKEKGLSIPSELIAQ
ncbi:MAG: TAXI family TRAP transporter solute-binding subunit [Deltaproteobacteria bacterium]|nr:TAXI family TRAP transporter solute-binding subunit [Deltaproteobacteria bacterium]